MIAKRTPQTEREKKTPRWRRNEQTQIAMDKALDGAVIIDSFGNAWQKSGYLGRWYRAYDGDGLSSFEVAQRGPVTFLQGEQR